MWSKKQTQLYLQIGPVNAFGPTGLKALRGTQEEAEYTNKLVWARGSGES